MSKETGVTKDVENTVHEKRKERWRQKGPQKRLERDTSEGVRTAKEPGDMESRGTGGE